MLRSLRVDKDIIPNELQIRRWTLHHPSLAYLLPPCPAVPGKTLSLNGPSTLSLVLLSSIVTAASRLSARKYLFPHFEGSLSNIIPIIVMSPRNLEIIEVREHVMVRKRTWIFESFFIVNSRFESFMIFSVSLCRENYVKKLNLYFFRIYHVFF